MVKIGDSGRPSNIFIDRLKQFEVRAVPLLVFWCAGFISVLVDSDHFKKLLENKLPITPQNFSGREYHLLLFILLGVVCLYSITYLYRLHAMVLEDLMERGEL